MIKRRSIRAHKMWEQLVNLPFTKSLHRLEHHMRHHFPKMNCRRRCRQTQFSSIAEFSNEMKLESKLPPFSLTYIWVTTHVLFSVLSSSAFEEILVILYADKLGILGRSRFHIWDRVLC